MATLVFSAIGTLVGGPIGGAVGALAGRQVDAAIFGGGSREGPRLKELAATTSSYGSPLPRHFGRMRAAGSVIWATDLVEHSETQGTGKGSPAVTTYSYTASFAVALASRPIREIGRIWADGDLLRGAAGDLKTGGTLRIYTGHGDQEPDPLIAAAEGADRCPAFRGLAYVVFEDLELGEFFNRIPALTFEIIADESFTLQHVVGEVIDTADAAVPLEGLTGFTCEGPLADTLALLDPVFPIDADARGPALTIARERLQSAPIALSEPALSVGDGEFGGAGGFVRKRLPPPGDPPRELRYYDVERDYLPGLQRAAGRPPAGRPRTVELPAAIAAGHAAALAERMARRADRGRDRLAWRSAELDPQVAPGAVVTLQDRAGHWRVRQWEWRDTGVELTLERVVPAVADVPSAGPADPGRLNPPPDLPAPATALAAFELPWDGTGSSAPTIFAAVSSPGPNWSGAALYADRGDGELLPLGPSGRHRSVMGTALTALPPAGPLLFDRTSSVVIELVGNDMILPAATGRLVAQGANVALLGSEILQFMEAVPLGERRWRLSGLLRGRGGTETAVAGHGPGEAFVLLDAGLRPLDPVVTGNTPGTAIVAAGRGDPEPVASAVGLPGITQRPLSPVHPRARWSDGTLELSWTRRARGAWQWADGVDVPLVEQSERYLVTYGPVETPVAGWSLDAPGLTLSAQILADLSAALPGGEFIVRQQGTHALSAQLLLASL